MCVAIETKSFIKERTIENYLDRIRLKSKGTVKNTAFYLARFDRYLQATYNKNNQAVFDEIIKLRDEQRERALYDIVQDYVNSLSGNGVGSGYIRNNVYAIKGYLRYYGFKVTSDDLKDNLTLPRVIEEEREPLRREQLQLIVKNQIDLRRALYLFMSSSGVRPSEALQIRKRDLELDKYERIMVRLPAKITKTKRPRITFISKETEKELKPYLNKINDDSFIFHTTKLKLEQAVVNELQVFSRLRNRLGFTEKYESGVNKISLGDSLRSWFVTKCNRVDYGFGHALAGHDQYMKRYDRLTIEDKLELYLEAEKLLQVFDYKDEEQAKKMETLQKDNESLRKDVDELKFRLELFMSSNEQKTKK